MGAVDLIVIAWVVMSAVLGARRGLVANVLGLAGFAIGALLGALWWRERPSVRRAAVAGAKLLAGAVDGELDETVGHLSAHHLYVW